MRSTFDELDKELEELRDLVASIAPVNSALAGHQDSLVRRFVQVRRRFDDAAFAVALYASFEKFIENLVAAYARLEARRVQYADLPQQLIKKHLLRTADILFRGRIGQARYEGLTELALVKNLFECLNGETPYTLNEAAVVAHDSNLRASEIDNLFAAVGFEKVCGRICGADALQLWYCATKELNRPPQDGVPATIVQERLKQIVERRNQVAHRGGNPIELLGADAMRDVIEFVEAFAKSIFAITVGRYLQDHQVALGQGIQLQQREMYKKGTVVVVDPPAQRLFVGQPVFVLIGSTGARWGRIQSIQVDDVGVEAVMPGEATSKGIGIALDFKCPNSAPLYALAADDDVVWSPAEVASTPSTQA